MKTLFLFPPHPFTLKRFFRRSCAGLLAIGICSTSHAAELVYDGFGVGGSGYTDGAVLNGNGHGTGWADASWTAGSQYTTDTGSIAPGSNPSENGVVSFGGGSSSQSFGRTYTPSFDVDPVSQTEAWASFAVDRNNTRDFRVNPFANNVSSGAGQYMGIWAANFSNTLYANIRWGNSSQIELGTSFTMTTGTEYFYVTQAIFNPSGVDDVFNVWVFESSSFTGTLPGSPTMSVSYDLTSTFDSWAVGDQNPQGATDAVIYDEFRIGDTFTDLIVVPEPSSFALLFGAGVISLVLRVRKPRFLRSSR